MSMKQTSRIAIALAALATSLAVASQLFAAPPPLKPYKVGYNAWIGSIAFFVARDKGFFKDGGSTCRRRASARRATVSRRC